MRPGPQLVVIGGLAILASCGGSSPGSPSTASAAAPVRLKVMTFNVQHGIDGTDRYNLQRAIDTIAAVRPDIVGLEEMTRNHPFYNCDDQPDRIVKGLRAATGESWSIEYRQEWFTPDVSCRNSGRGDGPETEGLALLTRRAMGTVSMTTLPDTRIGLAITLPDAYRLPVVVTHLSGGDQLRATRGQQVNALAGWVAGLGEPRILVGDFNAYDTDGEMQPLVSSYHDAFVDAQRMGRATGGPPTHNSVRIDFIFYRPGTTLTLESAEVIETRPLIGVEASDHKPVVATFVISAPR
jgi:endonuclease/exonuclease/phosphatase family metal-dependent hydrolase